MRNAALLALPLSVWAGACSTPTVKDEAPTAASAYDPGPPPVYEEVADPDRNLELVFENLFHVPRATWEQSGLRNPTTLQDAIEAVRSDNLLFFDGADRIFAAHLARRPNDVEAMTWHAQLCLVWVDAARTTERTLEKTAARLRAKREALESQLAAAGLDPSDRPRLESERARVDWLLRIAERGQVDLNMLAKDKLDAATAKTERVLELTLDNYRGYRLSADLYRISGDVERFYEAMVALEKLNPDSNGLLFMKAMRALEDGGDPAEAEALLLRALRKDPGFTKARYYLALSYLTRGRTAEAEQALDEILRRSPGHPFAHALRAYLTRLQEIDLPL